MRKYCLNCGKKFYPNSYYAYPQSDYCRHDQMPLEVPAEHAHFHSLSCMREWLARNHEAFTLLLTSMGNNDRNIETNNHN